MCNPQPTNAIPNVKPNEARMKVLRNVKATAFTPALKVKHLIFYFVSTVLTLIYVTFITKVYKTATALFSEEVRENPESSC